MTSLLKLPNLKKIIKKAEEEATYEDTLILENVFGFIGAKGGVGTSFLAIETAIACANKGYNTCLVDFNVFYPSIYRYLNLEPWEEGKGLMELLVFDTGDLRDKLVKTEVDKLWVLNSSPIERIERFTDIDDDAVKGLINRLKEVFDMVIIDIPNIPILEFCVTTLKYCVNQAFFVWNEDLSCPQNTFNLLDFLHSLGANVGKLKYVIMNKKTANYYDYSTIKQAECELVSIVPFIKNVPDLMNDGKAYSVHTAVVNKKFLTAMDEILAHILPKTEISK